MVNSDINSDKYNFDDNIREYIKKELKRGVSKELIKDTLVKVGHSPLKIEVHFDYLQKKQKKGITKILIFILILVLLIFVSFYLVSRESKNFEYLISKGVKLCNESEYSKSMEKFESAIQLNRTSPKGYGYKGWCLMKQGKFEESITEIKKSEYRRINYDHYSANPLFNYALGESYCRMGIFDKGIKEIKKAVNLNDKEQQFKLALENCKNSEPQNTT